MKVRHKKLGVELEVSEVANFLVHEPSPYYITKQGSHLAKTEWEPISTETWRDVTAECGLSYDSLFITVGDAKGTYIHALYGYRLRKVRVFDEAGQNLLNGWAFKVEKRHVE